MPDQKLTIIIPEDETVEGVVEVVQEWLSRGMTSGYYPDWTLRNVTESTQVDPPQRTAKEILDTVLGLESLANWEERIIAAVYLARSETL